MKTKIAIVSGILFAAILFTGISSSFMFPSLTCPSGTIVKNDVCVIASIDCGEGATYQDGVCVVDYIPMDDSLRDFDISKETKELQTLQEMSCDEIKYDSYNRIDGYLSGDNREFARDRILDCRAEMMESEEFAIYRELGCDGWIAMDGKLHIINSNQVRDWVALEILDCKGRSLNE